MRYQHMPDYCFIQHAVLKQLRSGATLIFHRKIKNGHFTMDGVRIGARGPIGLIRKGLICVGKTVGKKDMYVETIKP